MKTQLRFLSILLLTVLVLPRLSNPAAAEDNFLIPSIRTGTAPFQDTQGTWCESSVQLCWQTGLLDGISAEEFSPSDNLNLAQIIVISARLQDLLAGGTGVFPKPEEGEDWFMPAYRSLSAAGENTGFHLPLLLEGVKDRGKEDAHFYFEPEAACSRGMFVEMLSYALKLSKIELPRINDVDLVIDSLDPEVIAFYEAGILSGIDRYGTFNGDWRLNRGQAAAMLARLIAPSQRLVFSLEEFNLCKDLYHLEPSTVLFTVNGTEYTAEQYAPNIASCIQMVAYHGEPEPKRALFNNLEFFCEYWIAPEILAERYGLSLSQEELDKLSYEAEAKDGYAGLSSAFWLWHDRIRLLKNKAEDYIGHDQDELLQKNVFLETLWEVGDELLENTVLTPAFYTIDLDGIEDRAGQEQYPTLKTLKELW